MVESNSIIRKSILCSIFLEVSRFFVTFHIYFRDNSKLSNQTEIIYTVFVGGKPVLATTAAQDMKLITQEEVAHVMENIVYTKAERKTIQ